ncbi:MAG: ion channel [Deltaproteobacteria bacterium]|nr:ion channel [Deltaproteobacteria bacterium]
MSIGLRFMKGLYRERFVQIAIVILSVIFFSSLCVYYFERARVDSNIRSLWDGVWWAIVTMGTVGYGDKYPITTGGRIVGLILIFAGVGLMSLFTATIASIFVEKKLKEGRGLETVKEKDHIVICGWNQHTEEVLQVLTTYGTIDDTPIILINELTVDDIDSFKLKYNKYNLKFLRGNYVHEDVLLRANIAKAKFALIMADTSGSHPLDRIDERTTLAALTIKSIAPKVKTIAELLDGENRQHLKRANVDEIIVRGEHVGSLLASAINSPGLPKIFSSILSLTDTNKLWRVEIPRSFIGRTFKELSTFYREKQHAILLGLLMEKKAMKLEDLLSDDTSIIDTFIKEKIKEAKKDLLYKREEIQFILNPDDGYIINEGEFAVILSKVMPAKFSHK